MFFSSIRYLHLVPQLVREPDRSVGRTNDPFGGDFLEQVAKTQERTRTARLGRIQRTLRVAVPQLEQIDLWRDARGTPHLRCKYQHWRAQGAWQSEEQFSDGTLRLMGLLWAAMASAHEDLPAASALHAGQHLRQHADDLGMERQLRLFEQQRSSLDILRTCCVMKASASTRRCCS